MLVLTNCVHWQVARFYMSNTTTVLELPLIVNPGWNLRSMTQLIQKYHTNAQVPLAKYHTTASGRQLVRLPLPQLKVTAPGLSLLRRN